MSAEQLIRAFLAIELSAEVLNEISGIQSRLRKMIRGDIRWVRPEGIHLTLKFLGNLASQDIAKISEAVKKNIVGVKPPVLEVKGIGVFPNPAHPRVLWLGMEGDVGTLIALQKNIDRELQTCGFKKEEKPFHPHLTLGRIRSHRVLIGLDKAMEGKDDYRAGRFSAGG